MATDEQWEQTHRLIEWTARIILLLVASMAAMFLLGLFVGAHL